MSTVYTIEIQGSKTNLLTANADYDYEYDAPNFKFTFQSGASESATHINPAIDQNSISTIGEECSIINGGAVSSMTSTPTVTLTGAELMAFIKANGINLVNCSIIVNATIDTVTSTLFTGVTSSVEYVDAITIRLKSIEDGLSIDDAPIVTLSEDSAPGIDPTLYGSTVPVVIGDQALVKMYPISSNNMSSPSITYDGSLFKEMDKISGSYPYLLDPSGNPCMNESFIISEVFNDPDDTNVNTFIALNIAERGLSFSDSLKPYYEGYSIEITSGSGKGNTYEISRCLNLPLHGSGFYLSKRIPDTELTQWGSSSTGDFPYVSVVKSSVVREDNSPDTELQYYPYTDMASNGTKQDGGATINLSSSNPSRFRFVSRGGFYIVPRSSISQTIDGFIDPITIEKLWTKETGFISDVSATVSKVYEDYILVSLDSPASNGSITIEKVIRDDCKIIKESANHSSSGFVIDQSGGEAGSFFDELILLDNNAVLYTDGDRGSVFNGSAKAVEPWKPSPTIFPYYVQTAIISTYTNIRESLLEIDNLSSLRMKHNFNMYRFGITDPSSVIVTLKCFFTNTDDTSSGFVTAQQAFNYDKFGIMDMITEEYSNSELSSFASIIRDMDLGSISDAQDKEHIKYLNCIWTFRFLINEPSVSGSYFLVDMGAPSVFVTSTISFSDLYCTLVKPTGSPDIISASDIVRLSLLSSGQTIDEASFANARASMPSAVTPSITSDNGDLSGMISDVCKWSGMSLIKDRIGTYNAKWWINDEAGATPSRTFTHADLAEKTGVQVTKDSTGFACSKFGFKVTDGVGNVSALTVNPGTVDEFPLETAWSYGAEAFRQHTNDTWAWMGLYNGHNYYLYSSDEALPLTPRNPFVKGSVYAITILGKLVYVRLIDFRIESTGNIALILKTEQGVFWESIIPGRSFFLARSQPDWKYLVSGSGVTSLDYQTARKIWMYAKESKDNIGKVIPLPNDISEVTQNIFGTNASAYIEQIVSHNARQKQLIDFEVKLDTQNIGIALLDWVQIEAGPFVAYPIRGWVINVNFNPGAGTVGLTVMAFDQDFSGNFVINENHTQGMSAPVVITEATPSTNIYSEA